jgi:hypothetical protein
MWDRVLHDSEAAGYVPPALVILWPPASVGHPFVRRSLARSGWHCWVPAWSRGRWQVCTTVVLHLVVVQGCYVATWRHLVSLESSEHYTGTVVINGGLMVPRAPGGWWPMPAAIEGQPWEAV